MLHETYRFSISLYLIWKRAPCNMINNHFIILSFCHLLVLLAFDNHVLGEEVIQVIEYLSVLLLVLIFCQIILKSVLSRIMLRYQWRQSTNTDVKNGKWRTKCYKNNLYHSVPLPSTRAIYCPNQCWRKGILFICWFRKGWSSNN